MIKPDKKIQLKVHGTLNDFLKDDLSDPSILSIPFELSPSLKDLVEAKSIPHTAIFRIEVNGEPESMNYNVASGDEVDIFPFKMVDSGNYESIFASPPAFIADGHLARLGRYLRLLGLDSVIAEETDEKEIIHRSNSENRMILTRDLNLLRHGSTRYGYWVRSEDPDRQLEEIFSRFDLGEKLQPFSRCMSCNGILEKAALEEVRDKVPYKVQQWCDRFHRCKNCGKVYWKGSHYDKLKEKVERLVEKTKS